MNITSMNMEMAMFTKESELKKIGSRLSLLIGTSSKKKNSWLIRSNQKILYKYDLRYI